MHCAAIDSTGEVALSFQLGFHRGSKLGCARCCTRTITVTQSIELCVLPTLVQSKTLAELTSSKHLKRVNSIADIVELCGNAD